jgi:hypothetical protein
MHKLFVVTLAVALGLALAAGDAWAGKGVVLNEKQLDGVWGAQLIEVDDVAVAVDNATASQADRGAVSAAGPGAAADEGGMASSGSGAVSRTENETSAEEGGIVAGGNVNRAEEGGIAAGGSVTRTEHENDAEDGAIANSGTISQTVSNAQNNANGQNLSNAMLSAVVQQNNISNIGGSGTVGHVSFFKVHQSNRAHINMLKN